MKMKTLNIKRNTYARLKAHKNGDGEPFNSVLIRLLDKWEGLYDLS